MKELRDQFRKTSLEEFFYVMGVDKSKHCPDHVESNGRTRKISNPIDYLIYVLHWDMQSVDQFIAHTWSENLASKTPYEVVRKEEKRASFYRDLREQITMEWDYLGVQSGRIQAIDITNKEAAPKPIRVHAHYDFLTLDELLTDKILSYLAYLNANNHHIFMSVDETIDKNPHLILIDDFSMDKYNTLVKSVGLPNMIIQTSPDNYQVLYRVDTRTGEERRRVINAFNALNATFGDPKCLGLRHPFRLVGFRSKKAGRDGFMTSIYAARREGSAEMEVFVDAHSATRMKRPEPPLEGVSIRL